MTQYNLEIGIDGRPAEKGGRKVNSVLEKLEKQALGSATAVGKLEKQALDQAKAAQKAANDNSRLAGSVDKIAKRAKLAALAVAALAAALAVALVRSVVRIGVEFEQLRAQLKTVEGGVDGAENAFRRISEFAKATPFEVSRITEAWINLRGVGLAPTMAQFNALGNLAAARGKDITEASLATTSAIFGETERLKGFGISAKVSGDQITLSYKGASTTVQRSADEILKAIAKISDDNFPTAMKDQAKTVAGAWSNVKDAYAQLADEIFTSGLDDYIVKVLRTIATALSTAATNFDSFRLTIKIGIAAIIRDFFGFLDAVAGVLHQISKLLAKIAPLMRAMGVAGIAPAEQLLVLEQNLGRIRAETALLAKAAESHLSGTVESALTELTQSASDFVEELGNAPDAISELQQKIQDQIQLNAILELEVEASQAFQEMLDQAFREVDIDEPIESLIQGALNNADIFIPGEGWTTVDPVDKGAGPEGSVGFGGAAAGGAADLVQGMSGVDDIVKDLVRAFSGLANAMSGAEITANDWITLIVQVVLAFVKMGEEAAKKQQQAARDHAKAMNDLADSLDKLEAETRKINEKYDKILKDGASLHAKLYQLNEKSHRLTIKQVDALQDRLRDEELLAEIERKRSIELRMATRQVQEEGFSGLIDLYESLGSYLGDTADGQRMLQELAQLRLELEIINYRIQLDMISALGTVAQETLNWISDMIDTVEAGLRSGDLQIGGARPRGVGRPKSGSGQSPRDVLADLLDTLSQHANIQESVFAQIQADTEATLAHVAKMRMSEEERAAIVADILARQAAAHEELGLTLLERIYQATGNEEKLHELQAIRFEMQRARDLEEIDMLLTQGDISDEMRQRLYEARLQLDKFEYPELPQETRQTWQQFIEDLNIFDSSNPAQQLRDAMDGAIEEARGVAENLGQFANMTAAIWDQARMAAEDIALTMIDSLAQAVDSEEDLKKIARLRHFMEVQSYRAQAELLKPLLEPDTYDWLVNLIDQFEAMDPTAGIGSNDNDPRTTITDPITTAIDDQTDALQNALNGLQDAMNDVLVGDLSPLSPEQQWQRLQAQKDQLIAAARTGDVDAIQQLERFVGQYASFLSDYSGGPGTAFYAQNLNSFFQQLASIPGITNPLLGTSVVGGPGLGGNVIDAASQFRAAMDPVVAGQTLASDRNVAALNASRQQAHDDTSEQTAVIQGLRSEIQQLRQVLEDREEQVA